MNENNQQNKMLEVLDYCYEKVVNGVSEFGLDSADELAKDYMSKGGHVVDNANELIRWQIVKTGTSGFITGLGGLFTLPVAIPANIASVLYVQIRMVAAIAVMGGYDIKDDRVKSLVYVCLCGSAVADTVKGVGVNLGTKLTMTVIKNISGATLTKINQAVGFRLLTKAGETGLINLGKTVPILGGLVGGAFDGVTTNTIGNVAIKTFL